MRKWKVVSGIRGALGHCGSPGNKNERGWFPRELGRETEEAEFFGSLSMILK